LSDQGNRSTHLTVKNDPPSLPMLGCYLGAFLAGDSGALIGNLAGGLIESLLIEPDATKLELINSVDFPLTRVDDLIKETPQEDLETFRQDFLSAFRDATCEAIIDLGGKKCFPEEYKKRNRQPGKYPRSSIQRNNRQAGQIADELNELYCSYLQTIHAEIYQLQSLSLTDIGGIQAQKLFSIYQETLTYQEIGQILFDRCFLPTLQRKDPEIGSLWDFKTSISPRFLDRLLINLESQLKIRLFSWQSINRLILEAVRRVIQHSIPENERLISALNHVLDSPDSSLLASWSEEMAALLAALSSNEQRNESQIVPLCRQVIAKYGSTRVYLFSLLGLAEQTESLISRADSVFLTQLNPKQQEITRRIFIRLTKPGDGCLDTARQIQINDLFPSLEDAPAIEIVIKILAEAGLVRLVRHMVVPASDNLIQKWTLLRKWLDEDRRGLWLFYELSERAHQWQRSRRSEDHLLSGGFLVDILDWSKSHPGYTNPMERELINTSLQKKELNNSEIQPKLKNELDQSRRALETEHQRAESYRMQAEAEHQRAESLTSQTNRLRVLSWFMAGGIILVILFALISFSAWSNTIQDYKSQANEAIIQLTQSVQGLRQAETAQAASTRISFERSTALAEITRVAQQREEAFQQAKDILANLLAVQSQKNIKLQPDLSLLLAIEAVQLVDQSETRSSLMNSLQSLPYISHILHGHTTRINTVAFNSDGRLIASGAEDGTILIWQTGSGLPYGEKVNSNSGAVQKLAFSPDGKSLASVTGDRNVYLWNLTTNQVTILPINEMIAATTLSFSPDGKHLAVAGESRNNAAVIIDLNTGKQFGATLVGHTARIQSITFSPEGQFLATTGWDRTVIIWDKNTQRPIISPFRSAEDRLTDIAFHPDGNIVAASGADHIIYFWNIFTGREIFRLRDGHSSLISGIAFSSDGKTLVSVGLDGIIQVWNLTNRQKSDEPFKGHIGEVNSVAFHPNGVLIASGGQDQKTIIWDLRADQPLTRTFISGAEIKKAALNADGRLVAQVDCSRFDGGICLQDEVRFWTVSANSLTLLPGRQPLRDYRQIYGVQFSPEGSIIAIAGCQSDGPAAGPCYQHGVRLYLTLTGQQIGVPLEGHTDYITAIAFSQDGRILATGSRDRTIRIWDGSSGTFSGQVLRSHTSAITALEFSPDGKRLTSAGLDRTIRTWDTSTWLPASQPLRGNSDSVFSLVYMPDGRYFFTGGADRTIIQWNSNSLTLFQTFVTSHTGAISQIALSADQSTLYTIGNDRTIRVWDILSQVELGQAMRGHNSPIHSLNISRDGDILMTASRDRIRIWELNSKAWQAKACQIAGRNLTQKEWNALIPGQPYRKTCSTWDAGK